LRKNVAVNLLDDKINEYSNCISKVFAFIADLIFFQQNSFYQAVAALSLDLAGLFGVWPEVAGDACADPLHLVLGNLLSHVPYDAVNPWPVRRNLGPML
jgi:hypothetical protein